jgi:hypothetical protein
MLVGIAARETARVRRMMTPSVIEAVAVGANRDVQLLV